MVSYLHQLAVDQLQALDPRIRLVIIHPNYCDQHLLLTNYLHQENAFYLRFHGHQLLQADLESQFEKGLSAQEAHATLSDGVLLLDEVDRAPQPAMSAFLAGLIERTEQGRVLIFSRVLPVDLLAVESLRRLTAVIPTHHASMLADYAQPSAETDLLEVRAFGEGHVFLNGRLVDNWDGVLPRSLFFYLVDRGMTTRNDIFETFWPALPVREATNVFHVTKRKISEVLGLDLTAYWSGFYRISPNLNLIYDVVQFNETVNESAILPDEQAAPLLSQGLRLYRGHFLTPMEMPWVHTRRGELAQNYGEAMGTLAKMKEDAGQEREALGLYLRAAAYNRNREDLIVSIMNLYRKLSMYGEALVVYERLVTSLRDDLGVAPAPTLQQLAAVIRNEMNA